MKNRKATWPVQLTMNGTLEKSFLGPFISENIWLSFHQARFGSSGIFGLCAMKDSFPLINR